MFRRHVLKDLSSYIDNQLSESKKIKLEEHLKLCLYCSQELSRLKALSLKLKAWQAPEITGDFEGSLSSEIVRQELERGAVKMKKKTLAILIPSGALVTIVAVVFLGQLYLQRGFQGRLQENADNLAGYEFDSNVEPDKYAYSRAQEYEQQTILMQGTKKYDPYYVRSDADKSGISGMNATRETADYGAEQGPLIVLQPVIPATSEGEKVIRTGEVRLEVGNGQETYKKASSICQELGGYISDSQFYKDNEGRESGRITMRIPKDKFLIALDKLSVLGTLESSNTHSQDISQEYRNLTQELDITMVVYNKMIEEFKKRQVTIPQAMRLESEITPVLQKIEILKNRLESLNNAVSFTTVTVYLHEPLISVKVLQHTKVMVKERLLASTINIIKFVAGNLPVLILLLVIAGMLIAIMTFVGKWLARVSKHE